MNETVLIFFGICIGIPIGIWIKGRFFSKGENESVEEALELLKGKGYKVNLYNEPYKE